MGSNPAPNDALIYFAGLRELIPFSLMAVYELYGTGEYSDGKYRICPVLKRRDALAMGTLESLFI